MNPEILLALQIYLLERSMPVETGCVEWLGAPNSSGYGTACFMGVHLGAHVMSYVAFKLDDVLPGEDVCHTCDNPPCINPTHLFSGSRVENMQDSARKGRNGSQTHPESRPRGDEHWTRQRPDRVARGVNNGAVKYPERLLRGEQIALAVLNPDKVREMRLAHFVGKESFSSIGRRFGISHVNARNAILGITWKHVQ